MNWIIYSVPIIEYTEYGEKHKHINQPVNMAFVITYFKRSTKQIDFYHNSTINIVWKFESEEERDETFDNIGTFLNIKTI